MARTRAGRPRIIRQPGPKLSIVVVTYNRPKLLRRCLDSMKTSVDCEIVVIDNASPLAETREVLDEYSARDPRIRVIRNAVNSGAVHVQNEYFLHARGRYLADFGDDDSAAPGYFEKAVAVLDANPDVGVVLTPWNDVDPEGNIVHTSCRPAHLPQHSYIGHWFEFLDLLPSMFQAGSYMFRRRPEIDYFDTSIRANDWDFLLRQCFLSRTAYIAEALYNNGVQPNSEHGIWHGKGQSVRGHMNVWRKWLVEHTPPPLIDDVMWQRMRNQLLGAIQWDLNGDPAEVERCLEELAQIRRDHTASATRYFGAAMRYVPQEDAPSWSNNVPRSKEPGTVVWGGAVLDGRGYGSSLRAMLAGLDAAGVRVRAEDIRFSGSVIDVPTAKNGRLNDMMWTPLRADEHFVQVWHTPPNYFLPDDKASAVVGRTSSSTDRLPGAWVEACNRLDRIWVPSEFHVATFSASGVEADKLRILPECVEDKWFARDAPPSPLGTGKAFNFVSVFEWLPRKGWDVLMKAFVSEFRPDEDVALVIQTYSDSLTLQAIHDQIKACISQVLGTGGWQIPPVNVGFGFRDESFLAGLLRSAQAFVLPARSVPWGRAVLMAMASGLPVLATNWGANLMYLSPENSYPIEYRLVPIGLDEEKAQRASWGDRWKYPIESTFAPVHECAPTFADHQWAEPSLEHLRAGMRHAYEHRAAAAELGMHAREDAFSKFRTAVIGSQLRNLLSEVRRASAGA